MLDSGTDQPSDAPQGNLRLSIVIPCLNAEQTIEATLRSIIDQELRPHEVIIQDGGSTDGTIDILKRLSLEFDNLQYVSEPDTGQSNALNRAINRTTGDYIGWLNADDIYMPSTLALVHSAILEHPSIDVVFGDFIIINEHGQLIRRYHLTDWDWERFFSKRVYVWSGAMFLHKSVFERFGLFDENLHYCMDAEFVLRIGQDVSTYYIPSVLGAFRIHSDSKSGASPFGFIREGHAVHWKYSRGSFRLRMHVLTRDVQRIAYILTRRIWLSGTWSRRRRYKNL